MATDARVESWALARRGPFARLFLAGFVTSVGWAALFAQITLAEAIAGAAGIDTVLAARLLPGLLGGAIGGLLAGRGSRLGGSIVLASGLGVVWSARDAVRTPRFASAARRSIAAAGRSLRGGEEPRAGDDGEWAP